MAVPVDAAMIEQLGLCGAETPWTRLELPRIDVERSVQDLRPNLLGCTDAGIVIAIEVAYSSFCDLLKLDRFIQLGLPALEIDLRAFTPKGFDPEAVRIAVLHDVTAKTWLWPKPPADSVFQPQPTPAMPAPAIAVELPRPRLPEEIVTVSGRWASIKEFSSGDLAVKVITYDQNVVSMVKTIAKANYGRYSPTWKSWNVPRWRADVIRGELRRMSESVPIVLKDSS